MGYITGFLKYVVKTPITFVGFISMYIFGGGILSVWNGLSHLLTGQNVLEAIRVYFMAEYLPPTSIEEVLFQTVVGTIVAGLLWFWASAV